MCDFFTIKTLQNQPHPDEYSKKTARKKSPLKLPSLHLTCPAAGFFL
jgi:hypothetical protein